MCSRTEIRVIGLVVALLAALSIGLGIADVVIAYGECSGSGCPLTTGLALTWVAVGIWGGLVCFITGLILIYISGHDVSANSLKWVAFLVALVVMVFNPAMIIISVLSIYYLFDFEVPGNSTGEVLFALPLTIACAGFVIWTLLLFVFISICCGRRDASVQAVHKQQVIYMDNPMHAETGMVVTPRPACLRATTPIAVSGIPPRQHSSDVDRLNMWSAHRFMNNGGAGGGGASSGAAVYSAGACARPGCYARANLNQPAAVASSYYHIGGQQVPSRCQNFSPSACAARGCGHMPRYNYY